MDWKALCGLRSLRKNNETSKCRGTNKQKIQKMVLNNRKMKLRELADILSVMTKYPKNVLSLYSMTIWLWESLVQRLCDNRWNMDLLLHSEMKTSWKIIIWEDSNGLMEMSMTNKVNFEHENRVFFVRLATFQLMCYIWKAIDKQ